MNILQVVKYRMRCFNCALYFAIACACLFAPTPAYTQEAEDTPDSKITHEKDEDIAATVNGIPIYRNQLDELLMARFGKTTLGEIIEKESVRQAAEKEGIQVTPETLDARVVQQLEKMKKSNEQLATHLRNTRQTMEDLERNLRWALEMHMMLEGLIRKNTPVDEEVLQKLFEKEYGARIEARHIMLKDKETAEDILAKLSNGADFETLAEKHSIDKGSRKKGGLLAPFGKGYFQPEFEQAVFALEPGQLSSLVRTSQGYHIIKLIRKIPPKDVSFESVREALKEKADKQPINPEDMVKMLIDIRKKAKVTNNLEHSQ